MLIIQNEVTPHRDEKFWAEINKIRIEEWKRDFPKPHATFVVAISYNGKPLNKINFGPI